MIGSLKFLLRATALVLVAAFIGCIALILFYMGVFGFTYDQTLPFLSLIIGAIFFALIMSFYSYYLNIAISYGSTRKTYFEAVQVFKIGLSIILALGVITISGFQSSSILPSFNSFMSVFAIGIIGSTLSESFGIFCLRMGKIGMIIYVSICAIVGGIFGATFSLSFKHGSTFNILPSINSISFLVIILLLVGGVVVSVINWLLTRKVCVR